LLPVVFQFNKTKGEVFEKVKAFEAGGVDYISKPFQAQEVLARVENQIALI
jgi:DNA-binding response OmpR family regulator